MSGVTITDEIYWQREVVTPDLAWLGDELCRRTGQPATAAGDKGNEAHRRGSHRSQDWILHSVYCTNRTYTVQSGLAAAQLLHIAGFDFTPGNATAMIAQCKRLMAAMRAGQLEEVRELYGNVDGDQVVDGWNNLENRAASSDSSHLWHWHLGLDRRHLTDRSLMERIVAIALGDDMEQKDLLAQKTAVSGRTVGHVLADVSNLRDWLYGLPGATAGNPPPTGSRADLLVAAAQRPAVQPAPVDAAAVATALAPFLAPLLEAAAEAAVRRVLGAVDGATPS